MQPLNVVVACGDTTAAHSLAQNLNQHFRTVSIASNVTEARTAIPKHRAHVAIVDLETVSLGEVTELCREFSATSVVCTHRLPDEEMWAAALAAGAIDCCHNDDALEIVQSVDRNLRRVRSTAA